MLKNIDRVFLVLIVAAVAAGPQAEARDGVPFEIAAPRVGPAPGDRMHMKVAASNDQFLAVWADQRDWNDVRVWATRVSADGTPLDGIGLRIANAKEFAASDPNQDHYEPWPGITPIAAASDGSDFVVISRVGRVVRSSLVTADGKHVENKAPLPSAYSAALLWTGTEYMLIYVPRSRSYGDVQAVIRYLLIDRSGIQSAAPRDLVTTASGVGAIAASTGDRSSLMVAGPMPPMAAFTS